MSAYNQDRIRNSRTRHTTLHHTRSHLVPVLYGGAVARIYFLAIRVKS